MGCKDCEQIQLSIVNKQKQEPRRLQLEKSFVTRATAEHAGFYLYPYMDQYVDVRTPLPIVCPIHGVFLQAPRAHIRKGGAGSWCPLCKESKGEKKIAAWLVAREISISREHSFEGCRYVNLLRFDFYLPQHNVCIEYDGEHHYVDNDQWLGAGKLAETKKRDAIKDQYCKDNGIRLIRISYKEFDLIEEILTKALKDLAA